MPMRKRTMREQDGGAPREPWRAVRGQLRYSAVRDGRRADGGQSAPTGAPRVVDEHSGGSREVRARDVACWRGNRRW
jgi:hypothetical protein